MTRSIVSEQDYKTRFKGVCRSVMYWRKEGHHASWIINQLEAVQDELAAQSTSDRSRKTAR